jgi:magnesium-transporting ATPase (P-type)
MRSYVTLVGCRHAIATLQSSGVAVCMITGDMQATAEAIAKSLGFFDFKKHRSLSGVQVGPLSYGHWYCHVSVELKWLL